MHVKTYWSKLYGSPTVQHDLKVRMVKAEVVKALLLLLGNVDPINQQHYSKLHTLSL